MGGLLGGGLGMGSAMAADGGFAPSTAMSPENLMPSGEGWLSTGSASIMDQPVEAIENVDPGIDINTMMAEQLTDPILAEQSPFPEHMHPYINDMSRNLPASVAAPAIAIGQMETGTKPFSNPTQWHEMFGGKGDRMQSPMQADYTYHGPGAAPGSRTGQPFENKGQIIDKTHQWLTGQTQLPAGGGETFDLGSFWDTIQGNLGNTGKDYTNALRAGGARVRDWHPLTSKSGRGDYRLNNEQAEYLTEHTRPFHMGDPEMLDTDSLIELLYNNEGYAGF